VSGGEPDTAVTDVREPTPEARGADSRDCLVIIYGGGGHALAKPIPLRDATLRIGRSRHNELVLQDDRVSRTHARLSARNGRWLLCDEGSTHGTLLNNRRVLGYVELSSGDRISIGASIFKYLSGNDVESTLHEEIFRTTITDHLTGVANRRAFEDEIEHEANRVRRYGRAVSLLLIDIDHFKHINDRHGHVAGDAVLAAVAGAIHDSCREGDTIARYGGEEFAVIALEAALDDAIQLAERIRQRIGALRIEHEELELGVTVSVGCAQLLDTDHGVKSLLERADSKLYEAKEAGRNRIAY
jgi:two-component system cell cycle response regulator